ncbi:MAG: OprO/OprP family phosphate-selective porin [Alphaproteobacteria bacterium]
MIRKSIWLPGAAAVFCSFAAAPAVAAAKSPSYEELLQRIEALEKKVDKKDKRQDEKIGHLEDTAKTVQWSFDDGRPQIKTGDGNFSLAIRYRAMFDVASIDQSDIGQAVPAAERDLGSGAVVRRARFGFNGSVWKNFGYEFLWEFGGSGAEAASLYQASIDYTGVPGFTPTVGVFKPFFSMYENTSSNDIAIMERPAVVNTVVSKFGGGSSRRAGQLKFQKSGLLHPGDNFFLSGAWTGDPVGTAHGTDENSNLVGRAAYRLYSDVDADIQFGGNGATILSLGTDASTIRLRERPNIRVDGANRPIDTGAIPAEGGWAWGLEGVIHWRNFMLYGEYWNFGVERPSGPLPDPDFEGWYVEGSWIITGESKRYSTSSAVFGNPKVIDPVSLSDSGWGVWELVGRYDVDDLNYRAGAIGSPLPFGGIRGGKQEAWTVGLNWYLNNNVRVMFNYINVEIDRVGAGNASRGQRVDIVGMRFHIYN